MKILYAITKGNWGGAQKYVHDLAVAAKSEGHTVRVVYAVNGCLIERLADEGIETVALPPTPREVKLAADYRAYIAFAKILRDERPDVVHLNSSKIGGIGALAARTVGVKKIIFTAHGWAFNEKRPAWQRALIWLSHYATVLLCTHVICVSEAIKRDVRHMPLVQSRLTVIHNGIRSDDRALFAKEEARNLLLPTTLTSSSKLIGTIAELHPTKNIDVLIRAFAGLSSPQNNYKLILIGDGEEREKLEQLAIECGVRDEVHFLGHVADAGRYLRGLDLFVLASHSEALAYALLEAGVAQLPVVATNVGGIPEIIVDRTTGLLVPADLPAPLSTAIETMLNEPVFAKDLALALHAKVAQEFSLERMVAKTIEQYL